MGSSRLKYLANEDLDDETPLPDCEVARYAATNDNPWRKLMVLAKRKEFGGNASKARGPQPMTADLEVYNTLKKMK
eukprot:gene15111-17869_t